MGAFSPGHRAEGRGVHVFEAGRGTRIMRAEHGDCVTNAASAMGDAKLVTASGGFLDFSSLSYRFDDSAVVWEIGTDKRQARSAGHTYIVRTAQLTPGGVLISGGE